MRRVNDTVRTRSWVGEVGLNAAGAAVTVGTRPPPAVGMQPTNGLNAAGRDFWPEYVPVKTTSLVVVTPGFTGLPSRPEKLMSIARLVRRASTPPTMLPFGHFTYHERDGAPSAAVEAGIVTHGPETGMHTWRPRHSSAARADGAVRIVSVAPSATSKPAILTGAS